MEKNLPNKTVILFTRIPKAGRTKTRLMPFLSGDECVNLHYSFMADEIEAICSVADNLEVHYLEEKDATDDELDDFRSFLMQEVTIPFLTTSQVGSDIFKKMKHSFDEAFKRNPASKIVLVGCDIPTLRACVLEDAFEKIDEKCVYLAPSSDGGFYSIGMHKFVEAPFRECETLQTDVFEDALRQVLDAGKTVQVGPELTDIDVPSDLYFLWHRRGELNQNSLTKAFLDTFDETRFGRAGVDGLQVSVIVPVYNEISTIAKFFKNLEVMDADPEVVFVDGGSNDGTQQFLRNNLKPKQKFIVTAKGRASQMNAGARVATGDVYFFLHADSKPPNNAISEVKRVLSRTDWGCFGVRFDDNDPLMKICQVISNNRIIDRRIVFGDQGIFIKRELFDEIGGFPDIPIMEDYQFSLTLRDKGKRIGIARGLITTSTRRYAQGGKLKVMWQMNRLRKAYRSGLPPDVITEMYQDVR